MGYYVVNAQSEVEMKKRTGIKQIRGTDTMIMEYDNGTEETILNTEKIRTEVDYETALKRVEFLFDAKTSRIKPSKSPRCFSTIATTISIFKF